MIRTVVAALVASAGLSGAAATDYPIRSIGMRDVKVTRGFWFDRLGAYGVRHR